MFFTLFGSWARGGVGGSMGLDHKLLVQFLAYTSQKSKFPKLIVFDIVIT